MGGGGILEQFTRVDIFDVLPSLRLEEVRQYLLVAPPLTALRCPLVVVMAMTSDVKQVINAG